jgi:ADP-ribose pyrophosphatase
MSEKKKLTDEGFINFFKDENGFCFVETVGSNEAVIVLPRLIEDGEEYFCFIKEYRPAVDKYVYAFPAGCVETGEELFETVRRELKEEIGALIGDIKHVTSGYSGVGISNSYSHLYTAQVLSLENPDLQDGEDITLIKVKASGAKDFIKSNQENFCVRSALLALLAIDNDI